MVSTSGDVISRERWRHWFILQFIYLMTISLQFQDIWCVYTVLFSIKNPFKLHHLFWRQIWRFWLSCLNPLGFVLPKNLNYLSFKYTGFERTWWMLFQKGVVRTKLHIYVFIDNLTTSWNTFDDSIKYWEKKNKKKKKISHCRNYSKNQISVL